MDYYNDQQVDIEEELTYNNQAYYMPRLVLDRSKYAKGEKIPVVSIINHNITKDGDKVDLELKFSNGEVIKLDNIGVTKNFK